MCGISNVGRTAEYDQLPFFNPFTEYFFRCILYTTRPPDRDEINGRDFWFVSQVRSQRLRFKFTLPHHYVEIVFMIFESNIECFITRVS